MSALSYPLLLAWRNLLKHCRLNDQESVIILTGAHTDPVHLQSARLAVNMVGSHVAVLELGDPPVTRMAGDSTAYYAPTALTGNRPAQEALKQSDLVIDLMGMYRGSEQEEILATGTRIILVKEPPEVFIRLQPDMHDRTRVLAAHDILKHAKTMRMTSKAGTSLEVEVGQYPCLVQYGFADEPGRWDHCPSAFVATWPNEGSASGTVILNAGDTILPFKSYVQTPIELSIRNGFIERIDGGRDARYLRDYMAKFNDPDGYAVSHLGWGLQQRSHWTGLGMYDKRQTNAQEARSFEGCFMFSTGPNIEAGGPRDTACHLDIPMLDCTVSVDGQDVVVDGKLVQN